MDRFYYIPPMESDDCSLSLPSEPARASRVSRTLSLSAATERSILDETFVVEETDEFVQMTETFDLEVFRRRVLRILTSLRKIERKLQFELNTHGTNTHATGHTAEDQTHLWLLVKRMSKRIESLRMLDTMVRAKYDSLSRQRVQAQEASLSAYRRQTLKSSASLRRPNRTVKRDTRDVNAIGREMVECRDLLWKIRTVVESFEQLETDVMGSLVQLG